MSIPSPADLIWTSWALFVVQVLGVAFLIIYVWKTWEMADATRRAAQASADAVTEAKEARLEALAPRIVVYFDHTQHFVCYVVVENAGQGTAADVQLSFSPPLVSPDGDRYSEFLTQRHPVLPPGTRLPHWFATWPALHQSEAPKRYDVTVAYRGVENDRAYTVRHVLDANALLGRITIREKGVHDLVSEIEKLRETMSRDLAAAAEAGWAHARFQRFGGHREKNYRYAKRSLIATWKAFRGAWEADGVYLDWNAAAEYLRAEAITARRAAEFIGEPPEVIAQLQDVYTALSARYYWGNDDWVDKVQAAIDRYEPAA